MKIHFHKYQGTGNDFVILDNRNNLYSSLSTKQVRFMCDRRFGIGADGLMLLNVAAGYDFEMKYYNADGSESTMCGNGGRCMVKFAQSMGIQKDLYNFLAIDGSHQACFAGNGWIELQMKDVNAVEQLNDDFILDTGSPHYIKFVNDVESYKVYEEGRNIRYNDRFKEEGINVNFLQRLEDKLLVRTYERGVENETLSCGTGVTASALASAPAASGSYETAIQTPGGDLAVRFDKVSAYAFTNVWLCGPAEFVFEGEIELKD